MCWATHRCGSSTPGWTCVSTPRWKRSPRLMLAFQNDIYTKCSHDGGEHLHSPPFSSLLWHHLLRALLSLLWASPTDLLASAQTHWASSSLGLWGTVPSAGALFPHITTGQTLLEVLMSGLNVTYPRSPSGPPFWQLPWVSHLLHTPSPCTGSVSGLCHMKHCISSLTLFFLVYYLFLPTPFPREQEFLSVSYHFPVWSPQQGIWGIAVVTLNKILLSAWTLCMQLPGAGMECMPPHTHVAKRLAVASD
jgi:hypothetical protein